MRTEAYAIMQNYRREGARMKNELWLLRELGREEQKLRDESEKQPLPTVSYMYQD